MKIISDPRIEESTTYEHCFEREDRSGFSFPCDSEGKVDEANLEPASLDNYRRCLNGSHGDVKDVGVLTFSHSYRHPRIGQCSCGEELELDSFTNTCECGADYNSAGQLLAPREQWGDETGEHWTECY